MVAPKWFFISFMILLSLTICSGQPVTSDATKAKEADHDNLKAHILSNIDANGFGGGGGFGIGGGWAGGGGGGGSDAPNYGYNPGCSIRGCTVPGFGFLPNPGFGVPVYSPGCGYVCPADISTGGMTESKITGISQSARPYRCRPGPNMCDSKDCNELLLHFVFPMQDKHDNKQKHLRYGGRRGIGLSVGEASSFGIGFGAWGGGGGSGGGGDSDAPGFGIPGFNPGFGCPSGCGYACPANNPSGGITEFHISGLSRYDGPYRCRPDMCESEDCDELLLHFVSPKQHKHENRHDHRVERSEEEEAHHQSKQHKDDDIIN
ncbi:PREDICTED: anther-specific protein TA-29 [Nicotiana attenuata]|uniref:Anther-specific protein ta-29 n=1 Tax=Nicotiana attenuata TaxID=49451 RepID=A0A1J6IMJ9_NICAT|nr:PREDICTED: anther-specific protein TA-29 [Nicotiana attenuata]OIT05492.1 anther-specific protein ta-29 [Nicotiana attenuata]